MKTEYIKPEVEITLLETEAMIASSPGIVDGEATGNPALGNGRRGSWGNLWSEGEE